MGVTEGSTDLLLPSFWLDVFVPLEVLRLQDKSPNVDSAL